MRRSECPEHWGVRVKPEKIAAVSERHAHELTAGAHSGFGEQLLPGDLDDAQYSYLSAASAGFLSRWALTLLGCLCDAFRAFWSGR
jgi:hypothetical protein